MLSWNWHLMNDEVDDDNPPPSQLKLVNSECYTWLKAPAPAPAPKNDFKPDLFIASHENVLYRDHAYKNHAPACESDHRLFGTFAKWRCRDCLNSIWVANTTLNGEGKGKVFRYVQMAGHDCKDYEGNAVPMRGVAFDAANMMLVTGECSRINHAIVLRMDAAGSRQHLVDFLREGRDEWAAAVRVSCAKFDVSLGNINLGTPLESQILLGTGGFGRAYRLQDGALKISLGRSMAKEYEAMVSAHKQCPELVVRPLKYYEQSRKESREVLFSAYTMEDCGHAVDHDDVGKLETRVSLATALYDLHTAGLIHGVEIHEWRTSSR
jgi:hypothetical protein